MASAAAFPSVNTGAMDSCASGLAAIGSQMSDTSTEVSVLADAVASSEQWRGEAAGRWQTVVTGRVADASLTSEVIGKAASLLQQLAADLEAERNYYNRVSGELQDVSASYNPRFNPLPPDFEAPYIAAMNGAVSRATTLLQRAGNDFLTLAALADDVHAKGAVNRMPGVPAGTNRQKASLGLLTFLLGTVLTNQSAGSKFEADVLRELGLTKNTSVWRPGTAFEGKTTKGGLPRGTIPDADEPGFIVEIKDTATLQARFQIRLESLYARVTGRPLWVVTRGGARVDQSVVDNAEQTGGGVIYRTGPNSYEDGNGNPVQIGPGMRVTGYQPSSSGGSGGGSVGSQGPTDPGAPSTPVDPDPAPVAPDPGPVDPVGPGDPIDPFDLP
ncbi:MAG TPA: hypothetical protein VMI33_04955 [Streptosporangiaceae bacterium]|nr:hypothetical protein [Streptosporangiaceae bacterium]